MLDLIENVYDPDKNFYNGQQLTSIDGPIRNSYYTSHTGFLLRKYIDPVTGSEASGKSAVPYIISDMEKFCLMRLRLLIILINLVLLIIKAAIHYSCLLIV